MTGMVNKFQGLIPYYFSRAFFFILHQKFYRCTSFNRRNLGEKGHPTFAKASAYKTGRADI